MKSRIVLLLLLLPVSCRSHVPAPLSVSGDPERSPTNAEVLAYLEGKPLPVSRPGHGPLVVELGGIEALSVARDGGRTGDGAWPTTISFVYNTGCKRYTVEAVVQHQTIGDQRVFSALEIKRVDRR